MIEKKTSLIIERLLAFKEFSPLITISDTILQSSWPLIFQFLKKAKYKNIISIHIKTEISIVDQTISDHSISLFYIENKKIKKKDIITIIDNIQEICSKYESCQKFVILIDSINVYNISLNISEIITSILSLHISKTLIQIYHSSINLPKSYPTYIPSPLELLSYISTTIISVHSLSHELATRNAKDKALTTPIEDDSFIEGTIVPLDSNDESKIVISIEHRRKSGRGIHEKSVLIIRSGTLLSITDVEEFKKTNYIIRDEINENLNANFTLTLTDKQKKQKEKLILPYFKSQTINQKSSIYYSPDPEDDIDEEDPDSDLLL
ncbi:Elongator subunit IKI1 [Pneumocystis jirovecii RU7]|uniref:Elongator complex protein 5 n=1 Tax=Pneumocystis jirovecii (strain RU7) TaxID=1408657 RepID=A0A0W4ZDL9_PNEJ7|nr:Elongator subunit IKI1 [Pneumocystis jirovecii RU7]KTW26498.1 hypothetical protein T551_03415 [Pneumocystis jirovecii RU7]